MTLDIAKALLTTVIQPGPIRLDLRSETEREVFVTLVTMATDLVAARLVSAVPEGDDVLTPSLFTRFTPQVMATLPIALLSGVFLRLPVAQQQACLAFLYTEDLDRYEVCLGVTRIRWVRVGNQFIERVKADALLETMGQRLLSELLNTTVTVQDLDLVCDRMCDEFEWADVTFILRQTMSDFVKQKTTMSTADDLKGFLKANWVVSRFGFAMSDLILLQLSSKTLAGLARMPSIAWTLKLLNQFDVLSIQRLVRQAETDQLEGDATRRNAALIVLKATRQLVDMPEFETVRLAMGMTTD